MEQPVLTVCNYIHVIDSYSHTYVTDRGQFINVFGESQVLVLTIAAEEGDETTKGFHLGRFIVIILILKIWKQYNNKKWIPFVHFLCISWF